MAGACKSYKPAVYNNLRTGLLEETKIKVRSALQVCYNEHHSTGTTLVSDGWINVKGESVVKFLIVSPKGAVFHHTMECSAVRHTGEWLCEQMSQVLEDIGPDSVV